MSFDIWDTNCIIIINLTKSQLTYFTVSSSEATGAITAVISAKLCTFTIVETRQSVTWCYAIWNCCESFIYSIEYIIHNKHWARQQVFRKARLLVKYQAATTSMIMLKQTAWMNRILWFIVVKTFILPVQVEQQTAQCIYNKRDKQINSNRERKTAPTIQHNILKTTKYVVQRLKQSTHSKILFQV